MNPGAAGQGESADPSSFVATAEFLLRLRSRGIRDLEVLRAIERVPRNVFVSHRYVDLATRDVALPIGCGQTMAEPFALAQMLEALQLKPAHRVLEIGTGSGFSTAVMARLCAEVLSIERFQTLAVEARTRLEGLEVDNAAIVWADGSAVPAQAGLFDRIVVEAVVEDVPATWRAALAPGGQLLMARSSARGVSQQCVVLATPLEDSAWEERFVMRSRLQPLLDGVSRAL